MSDDLVWRDDILVLREAADAACLPCRQSVPLINQRLHKVAENGVNTFCSADAINYLMERRMLRIDRSEQMDKYSDLLQSHYSLCVKLEQSEGVLLGLKQLLLDRGYNPASLPIYTINEAVGVKNDPSCKCPGQTGAVSVNGCCVGCKLPIERP